MKGGIRYDYRCAECGREWTMSRPIGELSWSARIDLCAHVVGRRPWPLIEWPPSLETALQGVRHLARVRGQQADSELFALIGEDDVVDDVAASVGALPLAMLMAPHRRYPRCSRRELRLALGYARAWGSLDSAEAEGRELGALQAELRADPIRSVFSRLMREE